MSTVRDYFGRGEAGMLLRAVTRAMQCAPADVDTTARERLEEALRSSEARYRGIFEGAAVAIWEEDFSEVKAALDALKAAGVTDLRRYFAEHPQFVHRAIDMVRVTDVNPAAVRMLGASDRQALMASLHTIFLPETQAVFVEELLAVGEAKIHFESDASLRTLRGETLEVLVTIAFPPPGGDFRRVVVTLADITERRRTERALRESEARKSAMFDTALDCVISMDQQGRVVEFNPAAERTFGYRRDEALGQELATLIIPPAERERHRQGLARYLATGEGTVLGRRVEMSAVRADGGEFPIELSVTRIPAEGPALFTAYLRDITERRRAEQALRESEQRFRMLADNMAQLAWTCDVLGNVTWYNKRWLDYTGLSFEEMRGWDWSKVQHPDHLDRVVERVKRSAETGEAWEDTFPLRGKDGSYRWFLSRAVPIRDAAGAIVRWFGTNTDVTELREAQQALRQADRAKDEFLATLSHELRNPLAPLRNSLDLLRRAGTGAIVAQPIQEMMERQVNHLVRLVDDLMEMSRITRGSFELRREPLELQAVLRNALETARPLIDAARHRLTVRLPREPVWLEADGVRLAQVFANLLNNAAKFTPEFGEITLEARCEGDAALVAVSDTGEGVDPAQLPRLFEMFSQGNRTSRRSQGGLGIGLALARRLVEMHGGTLRGESAGPGKGSRFTVRLPLGNPSLQAKEEVQTTAAPLAPRRVLVVDDNRDAATSLGMLLNFLGADVRIAHDGAAALEAFDAYRPAIVLLDIGMPGMNGYEVARAIRAKQHGARVPLVAVTGWGQEEDRRRTREAGFDHHLVKPADIEALQALLGCLH